VISTREIGNCTIFLFISSKKAINDLIRNLLRDQYNKEEPQS
jgi:hypothetical protein